MDNPAGCPRAHPQAVGCPQAPQGPTTTSCNKQDKQGKALRPALASQPDPYPSRRYFTPQNRPHPYNQIRATQHRPQNRSRSRNHRSRSPKYAIGDSFVLYPNQLVLATTLEYVAMPDNAYADISPRSSYSRLGLAVGGMLQPGFRGCVPLELLNHGNVPVELSVGARICQIRVFDVGADSNYHAESGPRKYFGQVRPSVSKASRDAELRHLSKLPRVIRAAKQ